MKFAVFVDGQEGTTGCDRLGLDPREAQYIQGDTDQVFYGEGTGGSRSATLAGSAFHLATEKVVTKAAQSRRIYSRSRRAISNSTRVSSPRTRPTAR